MHLSYKCTFFHKCVLSSWVYYLLLSAYTRFKRVVLIIAPPISTVVLMGGAINPSLISARFSISTDFLTVQTYKRMHLITRVYSINNIMLDGFVMVKIVLATTLLTISSNCMILFLSQCVQITIKDAMFYKPASCMHCNYQNDVLVCSSLVISKLANAATGTYMYYYIATCNSSSPFFDWV